MQHVVTPGRGAGNRANVGTTYYNIGVAMMATVVEGARLALAQYGAPLTGDKLRRGLESIRNFNAQGLMPAITLSAQDHQGGGFGRISQWDGERWTPLTDWYASYQDLVWEEIRREAAAFRAARGR
jgi:branched-chain amino acid transport system substrate-binding protein